MESRKHHVASQRRVTGDDIRSCPHWALRAGLVGGASHPKPFWRNFYWWWNVSGGDVPGTLRTCRVSLVDHVSGV